jgi:hypothetical protein
MQATSLRAMTVGATGVSAPRPPQSGEHEHAAVEPLPRRVIRHQGRDLREREDEHEVEEKLERDDAFLGVGGHGMQLACDDRESGSVCRVSPLCLVGRR